MSNFNRLRRVMQPYIKALLETLTVEQLGF